MKLNIKNKFAGFNLPKLKPEKKKQAGVKKAEPKSGGREKKEKVLLLLVIFIGAAAFTYTQLSVQETDEKTVTSGAEITKMANKSPVPQSEKEVKTISAVSLSENPFVNAEKYQNVNDMSKTRQEKLAKEEVKNLPAIPNYTPEAYLPSQSLPSIPTFNIPDVKTQTIQGIMSDENGNKMAIINGKTVQEGDELNGTVISKINSRGITFDNGNQISYNIAH